MSKKDSTLRVRHYCDTCQKYKTFVLVGNFSTPEKTIPLYECPSCKSQVRIGGLETDISELEDEQERLLDIVSTPKLE